MVARIEKRCENCKRILYNEDAFCAQCGVSNSSFCSQEFETKVEMPYVQFVLISCTQEHPGLAETLANLTDEEVEIALLYVVFCSACGHRLFQEVHE